MTKEVKVSFYLKRNETKKDGKSPVMARLSIGKFSETIFLKCKNDRSGRLMGIRSRHGEKSYGK
jgi:hypothetical protein